jgi:hypothetical protein
MRTSTRKTAIPIQLLIGLAGVAIGFAASRLSAPTGALGPGPACATQAEIRREVRSALEELGPKLAAGGHGGTPSGLASLSAGKRPDAPDRRPAEAADFHPEGNADAMVKGQEIVAGAIQTGTWDEEQKMSLRELMPKLTPEQGTDLVRQVIVELNAGRIKSSVTVGAPF